MILILNILGLFDYFERNDNQSFNCDVQVKKPYKPCRMTALQKWFNITYIVGQCIFDHCELIF